MKKNKDSNLFRQSNITLPEKEKTFESVYFEKGETSDKTIKRIIRFQFFYSLVGIIIGIVCIVLGSYLIILDVKGTSDWNIEFLSVKSEITNAIPGVVLLIIGLFIVYVTRFKIRFRK